MNEEQIRINAKTGSSGYLEKWGPYLSDRQWGTVREDYSVEGNAWNYFPHQHAASRAYLWGEDGIGGICDQLQNLCFAPAYWNGQDPIIKERLFGLANGEGNHGEDVKELYYHLDNLPSHYYMKYLYKYPQKVFPYQELIEENQKRTRLQPEFEILDTDVFANGHYFDIYIEYAKQTANDIFIRIEAFNRGDVEAPLTILPTLWFYNRWQRQSGNQPSVITFLTPQSVSITSDYIGNYFFYAKEVGEVWFTDNVTNAEKLFGKPNPSPFVKDAFHEALIQGTKLQAVKENKKGTKCSFVYKQSIAPGASHVLYFRLSNVAMASPFEDNPEALFDMRRNETNQFYNELIKTNDTKTYAINRQAYAGLLWSKQFYYYDVEWWLNGSDGITPSSPERQLGRNHTWKYLKNQDIISMPDKWEYPWYAAWDLAYHTISLAYVDIEFAKNQLILLMREWYMNQDGQLPAYEWDLNGVNPPVHAFAALEVYRIGQARNGISDISFLKRIFQKLLINFTWWVNRKDASGNNLFEGGFLGLDNIGLFNRNETLGDGIFLEQSDGTSWMGMYALNMMEIAYEIATHDTDFEDSLTKFYDHFVIIAEALNELGLWNDEDNFFYDVLNIGDQQKIPLRVRSIVGLIPLFAVSIFKTDEFKKMPDAAKRMDWLRKYRLRNNKYVPNEETTDGQTILFSLVNKERLALILQRFVDGDEFYSLFGIRSLSKVYEKQPYSIELGSKIYSINYEPAESTSSMFGGNSNWRGPIWFPINYLFIKALKRYGEFYRDDLQIEFPKGSGQHVNLSRFASILVQNLLNIFKRNEKEERPAYGPYNWFYQRPENKDLILFYEYFDGDTGKGLGASHQTGWTALLINMLNDFEMYRI